MSPKERSWFHFEMMLLLETFWASCPYGIISISGRGHNLREDKISWVKLMLLWHIL